MCFWGVLWELWCLEMLSLSFSLLKTENNRSLGEISQLIFHLCPLFKCWIPHLNSQPCILQIPNAQASYKHWEGRRARWAQHEIFLTFQVATRKSNAWETCECGCFFVHWLVCRWTKKASVWKSGCSGGGLLCINRAPGLCHSAGKPHCWGTPSCYRINRSPHFLPSLTDLSQAGPGVLTWTSSKIADLQILKWAFWQLL